MSQLVRYHLVVCIENDAMICHFNGLNLSTNLVNLRDKRKQREIEIMLEIGYCYSAQVLHENGRIWTIYLITSCSNFNNFMAQIDEKVKCWLGNEPELKCIEFLTEITKGAHLETLLDAGGQSVQIKCQVNRITVFGNYLRNSCKKKNQKSMRITLIFAQTAAYQSGLVKFFNCQHYLVDFYSDRNTVANTDGIRHVSNRWGV